MAGVQTLPLDELPLLDPHSTVSFEKLMRLERLDDNTFGSLTRPFVPGAKHLGFARAYGGHVYAQSAWAAAQTLNETSNFLLHVRMASVFSGEHTSLLFDALRSRHCAMEKIR